MKNNMKEWFKEIVVDLAFFAVMAVTGTVMAYVICLTCGEQFTLLNIASSIVSLGFIIALAIDELTNFTEKLSDRLM